MLFYLMGLEHADDPAETARLGDRHRLPSHLACPGKIFPDAPEMRHISSQSLRLMQWRLGTLVEIQGCGEAIFGSSTTQQGVEPPQISVRASEHRNERS